MEINIGKKEKKIIYIPFESRFLNTTVFGKKGSGKTSDVLISFANQDLSNKDIGVTFIVNKGDMAYNLYTMAKLYKRKVTLIKPSISLNTSNFFLWDKKYDYDYINDNIIDFKRAIRNKEIIIIDMEVLKYKEDGIRATIKLLLQLQVDMQETDITLRTPHFLYIDDSNLYLPYIDNFLIFGNSFNLGTILFFQSRSQFKINNKDYANMIDNNVMNTILLMPIDIKDIEHFSKQFYEQVETAFYNRNHLEIIYEIMDLNLKRKSGGCTFFSCEDKFKEEVEEKSKANRRKLLKNYKNSILANKNNDFKGKNLNTGGRELKEDISLKIKSDEKSKKIEILQNIFLKMSNQEFLNHENLFK